VKRNLYIDVYLCRYVFRAYYGGKPIFITTHAIKQARKREIAFPHQVYATLNRGKVKKFGKHSMKFTYKMKKGAIICVGEDIGYAIIIKTVERGN